MGLPGARPGRSSAAPAEAGGSLPACPELTLDHGTEGSVLGVLPALRLGHRVLNLRSVARAHAVRSRLWSCATVPSSEASAGVRRCRVRTHEDPGRLTLW